MHKLRGDKHPTREERFSNLSAMNMINMRQFKNQRVPFGLKLMNLACERPEKLSTVYKL